MKEQLDLALEALRSYLYWHELLIDKLERQFYQTADRGSQRDACTLAMKDMRGLGYIILIIPALFFSGLGVEKLARETVGLGAGRAIQAKQLYDSLLKISEKLGVVNTQYFKGREGGRSPAEREFVQALEIYEYISEGVTCWGGASKKLRPIAREALGKFFEVIGHSFSKRTIEMCKRFDLPSRRGSTYPYRSTVSKIRSLAKEHGKHEVGPEAMGKEAQEAELIVNFVGTQLGIWDRADKSDTAIKVGDSEKEKQPGQRVLFLFGE